MKRSLSIKTVAVFLSPLLIFAVLFVPYSWLNSSVIVDVFGCGCPQINENGEMVHRYFSANDFTAIFWFFVAVCVVIASALLAMKKINAEKIHLRIVYVASMIVISLLIVYCFCQIMMWN